MSNIINYCKFHKYVQARTRPLLAPGYRTVLKVEPWIVIRYNNTFAKCVVHVESVVIIVLFEAIIIICVLLPATPHVCIVDPSPLTIQCVTATTIYHCRIVAILKR